MTDDVPPPGSDEAIDNGCVCPVIQNEHGEGYMGGDKYVMRFDCPIHGESEE